MLIRRKEILYWLIYLFVTGYVFVQYIDNIDTQAISLNSQLVFNVILKPQKLFFNYAIAFAVISYMGRISFFNVELFIRYKNKLFQKMMLHSVKQTLLFTFLTFALAFIISIVKGIEVQFDFVNSMVVFGLFIFLFSNIFRTVYSMTNKHFIGMSAVIISCLIVLFTYFGLCTNTELDKKFIYCLYNDIFLTLLNLVVIVINYLVILRKESL